MTEQAKEKLRTWLSMFPQSKHPLDCRKMYDLVIALEDSDTAIYDEDIREMLQKCKPDWNEDYVEEFIHNKQLLISELRNFLHYYRSLQ